MNLRRLSFLLVLGMLGCSANLAEDDDVDSSEDELQSECVLGTTCPSIRIARARSYFDARPRARLRTDLEIDFPSGDKSPRWFSRVTTRPMRLAENTRVLLSGDTDGTKGFAVDDFLLFEVIDPTTGEIIDTGYVGNDTNVSKNGAPLKRLAPPAAGTNEGFAFAVDSVDIASILPRDRAFRLRVSALDFAGVALVSDLFMRASALPPPPPPAIDPFDPASCAGPAMTQAEWAARFAPGNTVASVASTMTIRTRTRTCNTTTGCGPWSPTNQLPYTYKWIHDRWGVQMSDKFLSFPDSGYESGVRFVVRENGRLYVDFYASSGGNGFIVAKQLFGQVWTTRETYAGACTSAFCGYDSPPSGSAGAGNVGGFSNTVNNVFTNTCFRVAKTHDVDIDVSTGTRQNYETAIHGTL